MSRSNQSPTVPTEDGDVLKKRGPAELAPSTIAGDVYAPVLVSLLAEEAARKSSIEQRAISVITTSGALVSLLVALSVFLFGKDAKFDVSSASRLAIAVAVVLFVAAAVLALLVNSPRAYRSFSDEDVQRMVDEWGTNAGEARKLVSQAQAVFICQAVKKNDMKAGLLQLAVIAEVLGVSTVALAVILAVL
jgi:hypothetical protein